MRPTRHNPNNTSQNRPPTQAQARMVTIPANAAADSPGLSKLPAKHRAVSSFVKSIPPDQREDALLQAVLVGMEVIKERSGGKGMPGKEQEEEEDAEPLAASAAADKTQWINVPPAPAEEQDVEIASDELSATDEALTVDDLDSDAGVAQSRQLREKLDPRIYPEWWGHEEFSPAPGARRPLRNVQATSMNGVRFATGAGSGVQTRTKTSGPVLSRSASAKPDAQTITTTTTTVTTVLGPSPANRPTNPLKSASMGPRPASAGPTRSSQQPQPKPQPTARSMSWEIPLRGPTPPSRSKPRPKPQQQRPASPFDQPEQPAAPYQQETTPTPPSDPPYSSPEHLDSDDSPRSGLMSLVRSFLRDPIIECLDLGVLNMRVQEDEEGEEDGNWEEEEMRGGFADQ